MVDVSARIENGWSLYAHPVFVGRLNDLMEEVEDLARSQPSEFHHHPAFKLLECVEHQITVCVPRNPGHSIFCQGNTLGQKNRHWKRVKKGLPQRYRLFFQFRSTAPQTIIYAWLNDGHTLRKAGDRKDVYETFKKMLAKGTVPSSFDELQGAVLPLTI